MLYDFPIHCPVCQGMFHVKRLGCDKCGSVLEGNFEFNQLARLPKEMQQFVIVFLECRGNIREMEKYFSISYPTVRARIDEIVAVLNRQTGEFDNNGGDGGSQRETSRLTILTMLANGQIDIDEAQKLLCEINIDEDEEE